MLKIFTGPMFSGKTTGLIAEIKKQIYYGTNKPRTYKVYRKLSDDRDDEHEKLVSHSFIHLDAIKVKCVDEIEWEKYDIIGIDETHFWDCKKLFNMVNDMLLNEKIIIMTILNSDYRKKPFPYYGKFMSIATKIYNCKSSCYVCGKICNYTTSLKDLNNKKIILSDNGDIFKPSCEKHFKYYKKFCILISGNARVGKDTFGDFIQTDDMFRIALADEIRKIACKLGNATNNNAMPQMIYEDKDNIKDEYGFNGRDWYALIGNTLIEDPLYWAKFVYTKFCESYKNKFSKLLITSE